MSSNRESYKSAPKMTSINSVSKFACLSMDDSSDDDNNIKKINSIKETHDSTQVISFKKIKNTNKLSWTTLDKEKKKKRFSNINNTTIVPDTLPEIKDDTSISVITEDMESVVFDTKNYKFQNNWYVWVHEVDSKDWSIKSYKIIHVIESIYDFWQFFNNIGKLNQWKYNFFIMKANSHPTWEHSSNRNGGTCSIRIDISQSIDIIEQLAILLVNESLTEEINDINGISFAAKGNWCVIKIWNHNNKNNISNQIPSYLRKIYPSISIKYKENIPEY